MFCKAETEVDRHNTVMVEMIQVGIVRCCSTRTELKSLYGTGGDRVGMIPANRRDSQNGTYGLEGIVMKVQKDGGDRVGMIQVKYEG